MRLFFGGSAGGIYGRLRQGIRQFLRGIGRLRTLWFGNSNFWSNKGNSRTVCGRYDDIRGNR